MSDIREVSRWSDTEGHELDEYGEYAWPYPTEYILSEVTGQLRQEVIDKIGAEIDSLVTIREEVVSGGYSEYTQENDYSFELIVNYDTVWSSERYSGESNLAAFLKWLETE